MLVVGSCVWRRNLMDAIQTARERLKLLKMLAQSGREVAAGKVVPQKDLFKSFNREIVTLP